jgi:hypothetical protein
MKKNPSVTPRMGDRNRGTSTLSRTPSKMIAEGPTAASTAPRRPPMSAWLDELGMPSRQVMRFHAMAPISAAATTICPASPSGGVASPDAMVLATAVPVSAPTKFAVADRRMACAGRNARVDTDVAIALAVSWNPLM